MLTSPTMQKVLLKFAIAVVSLPLTSVTEATEPPITAVAFAPGGQTVVAVSQSGLHEFSWPKLTRQRTVQVAAANLHCLAFSADGEHLAIGGGNPAEEGIVEVFKWPEANPVARLGEHKDSVRGFAWVGSSKIISSSLDRQLKLWKVSSTAAVSLQDFSGHSRGVSSVLVLNDGLTMVTAGDDQSVRVWDLASGELIRSLNQHTKPIHSLALRPSDSGLPMVASAAGDRTIKFWQPTIGRMVRYVRLDSVPLCVAWVDEDRIAASCVDGRIRIVDTNEVRVLRVLDGISGWAYCLAVHPSGDSMAVAGSDGQIQYIGLNSLTPANR